MNVSEYVARLRGWFPVPVRGKGVNPIRWVLLDANRLAVTGAILTLTFVSILTVGTLWTFEIQTLLTDTQAVQTVINTFMSGIILLVSIVVSINSIVLSYDITPIGAQEERIEGTLEFRREVGELASEDARPTDPAAFLQVMAEAIRQRASALEDLAEGAEEEFANDVKEHADSVANTADAIEESLDQASGAEFGVLWLGLETNYGASVHRTRQLSSKYETQIPDDAEGAFDELVQVLELFATGREYFKTLYYSQEISELSRMLLIISLPSIIVSAITILAIDAQLLPDLWLFGLPPLMTFVAVAFTVALAPYIVLTSYMLRVATVANRTAGSGPFSLGS